MLGSVIAELARSRIDAVGHRVVHGGELFSEPTLIDDEVVATIRSLIPLAPLHNPANLLGIEAARRLRPDVPQVAVFDTAFHADDAADTRYRYAVPYRAGIGEHRGATVSGSTARAHRARRPGSLARVGRASRRGARS